MIRLKTDPPRGLLNTPAADQRRFRHQRYHPSADLDKYVEHYWVVEWDLRGEAPERAETLPHPSVHMIFEPDGNSRIRGLARAKFSRLLEDRSKRTLQRLFAKYVGVSPKWVIQRYRLNEAAEQLASGKADGQAELALKLGYSDQAHFIRDFKAIVGVSPAAYPRAARQTRTRGEELGAAQ